MDDNLIDTLESIGNHFIVLAEELKKHNQVVDDRLHLVEKETTNTKNVLKDVANTIIVGLRE